MGDKPGDGGPADSLLDGMGELAEGGLDIATEGLTSAVTAAWHLGGAVGDALSGDWDGASDQAVRATESAVSGLTDGGLALGEGAWDIGNAALGHGEATTAHSLILSGMNEARDWLSDEASTLVSGGDSGASAISSDPGSSADAGSASGGDASQAGNPDPGDVSAYDDAAAYADPLAGS